MKIRKATFHDAPFIKLLMEDLGQKTTVSLLVNQLSTLFSDNDNEVWVYEDRDMVTGFMVLHTLPKLASETGLLIVSCLFSKEQSTIHALERKVNELVSKRNCDRITL